MVTFNNSEIGKTINIAVMVEMIEEKVARNGNPFLSLTLRDMEGTKVVANYFDYFKNKGSMGVITKKDILNATVSIGIYNDAPSYMLKQHSKNEELSTSDFNPKAVINQKETWVKIIQLINEIKDVSLCKLACKVLMNNMQKFKTAPLTASDAYARESGLMEATYKLMTLANNTADVMELDKSLLLAGASIYYIGSVDMVDDDYQPTREVALIGYDIAAHDKLVKANLMLKEEDRADVETFQILENCLLSRWQGKPTATAEAFVLRELDSIIAVVDVGNKILEGLEEETFVDERPFNRKWYKRSSSCKETCEEVG